MITYVSHSSSLVKYSTKLKISNSTINLELFRNNLSNPLLNDFEIFKQFLEEISH